jgi:hypothetical protein
LAYSVTAEAEVADLLRGLEAEAAGLHGAARVERRVQHAEIGVTAASGLREARRLRDGDAALDVAHGLGRAIEPRQRGAERVVRVRDRGGGGAASVRVALAEAGRALGVLQRAPGPLDRPLVVAAAKREAAHLLAQVGELDAGVDVDRDGFAVAAEEPQSLAQAREAAFALAGVPVQAGELTLHARFADGVGAGARPGEHGVELRPRLVATTDRPQQVAHVLADGGERRLVARPAALQDGEGACVVAQGVFVGIDAARPVAGAHQVAGTALTVFAVAEVMAERLQVLEPRRLGSVHAFEYRAGALMQQCDAAAAGCGTRRHVRHGAGEAIARRRMRRSRRLHGGHGHEQFGIAQARAAPDPRRLRPRAPSSADSKAAPGSPRSAACVEPRAAGGPCAEQQALDRRRHFDVAGRPIAAPATVGTAGQDAVRDEAADDLFEIQRIAAGLANDPLLQRGLEGRLGAEERRQQGLDGAVGERLQSQHAVRDSAAVERGRVERRPARQHDQQRALAQPIGQRRDGFDRGRVGLQVTSTSTSGPSRGGAQYRAQRHRDLAPEPLGSISLDRSTACRPGCSRRLEPPARSRRRQRRWRACRARPLHARTPANRPARCRNPRGRGPR